MAVVNAVMALRMASTFIAGSFEVLAGAVGFREASEVAERVPAFGSAPMATRESSRGTKG